MTTAREAVPKPTRRSRRHSTRARRTQSPECTTEDAELLLTPNKPSAYPRRLLTAHGVLAFVVPTARLTAIEFELLDRASLGGFGTFEFRGAPSQACLFSPAD